MKTRDYESKPKTKEEELLEIERKKLAMQQADMRARQQMYQNIANESKRQENAYNSALAGALIMVIVIAIVVFYCYRHGISAMDIFGGLI